MLAKVLLFAYALSNLSCILQHRVRFYSNYTIRIHFVPVGPTCCSNYKGSDKLRIKRMLAKILLFAYVLSTLSCILQHCVRFYSNLLVYMLRESVTASLFGYLLLMHVKEFGQLFIGISSLLEKTSRVCITNE